MIRLGLSLLLLGTMANTAPDEVAQPLSLEVEGLRSAKGRLLVCVTSAAAHFPDCSNDPEKRHYTLAAEPGPVSLGTVREGSYAIAVIHDENGNGKLDTFAGIPREGVGFSRNPVLRFGAPAFRSAAFPVAGAPVRQQVRIKYFL